MAHSLLKASNFEKTVGGKKIHLFRLKNKNGAVALLTNYGARLISLSVEDRDHKSIDVVAGFETIDKYLSATEPYHGATVGRFCNRIANGAFTLDGIIYSVSKNENNHSLHGGFHGLHNKIWSAKQINEHTIHFTCFSPHLEDGFPGNLTVGVTYTLTESNCLKIQYEAETDRNTVLNLTNHAYFNLNGAGEGSILQHKVKIAADFYNPIEADQIPTGEIWSVKDTPFDFRRGTVINSRIHDYNTQLKNGNGYNHNFVLNKHHAKTPVASFLGDRSGILMEIYSDQPGLQFYTGNHFNGAHLMKNGTIDNFRHYFAVETQHFPNSPNQANFPSTILRPGQLYSTFTIYKFLNHV